MTREEAIKELRISECYSVLPSVEALDMAIKSLEQQSDDCVSRQAVDQRIYDYAESNGLSYANMKNYILDVPSVTPTQKTGHWIFHVDDLYPGDSTQECSVCHEEQFLDCSENYCPNCGAEMKGVENECMDKSK